MTFVLSRLAVACLTGLWQGAAIVLLAMALLRLLPRASAALRHALLLVLFLIAAVLPILPRWHDGMRTAAGGLVLSPWLAVVIGATWAAMSLMRAASLVMAWKHLREVRKGARPIAMASVSQIAAETRRANVCVSDDVTTPAVLGFFRPVLLLPGYLLHALSAEEWSAVARHECEHLKRRDDWTNLLLQVALVVMPLDPALLWLNRRIAVQRELACDAAVVEATAKPLAYAASLARMADQQMQRTTMRLALGALGRESELAQRIHNLLREPSARWTQGQAALAMTGVAAMLLAVSGALAHTPRLFRVGVASQPAQIEAPVAELRPEPKPSVASGAKMVPVSFEPHKQVRHLKRAAVRLTPARMEEHSAVEVIQQARPAVPHFVRTHAAGRGVSAQTLVDRIDDNARQRRTEFVPAYVAVPVTSGWLLIQL